METRPHNWADPGLFVLEMLFRLLGVDSDRDRIRRCAGQGTVDVQAMLRCAREYGLEARAEATDWSRLASCPLPGIAVVRGGSYLLLGKVGRESAIVLAANAARPSIVTREEFEALWDGRIVLIRTRGALAALALRAARALAAGALAGTRSLVDRLRPLAKPELAKEAAQLSASVAGAVVIDFAERARKVRQAVGRYKGEDERRAEELAFLPAALEITETPPSPLGRATIFCVIAIFVVALGWACIGTLDIVAVASGKIVPSGGTKTIQPFETAVVRGIHVRDGQSVKAGDVLIELDATMSGAELARLRSDLTAARLDAARLRAALAGNGDPLAAFVAPGGAPAAAIEMHRRFLVSQTAEQNAKLAAVDRQMAQKEAERATIKASIDKLKATLAPLQQRVDIREQLVQKELGSKLTYLTELQDLVGQKQEILVQQSRYNETDAAVASLMETRRKTVAEYERGLFDELAKADQKAAGLAQDVIKAEQRTNLQTLTAPVDGMVQQLAVHTVGGVVTPAQTLMLVVPANSQVEIEAMISNRDIGFVEAGQEAAIKIDTFNFTRYGLLRGSIQSVSQDAITRERPQDRSGDRTQGAEASSSEPRGQELVYAARISIDQEQMEIEDRRVNLAPGMAVTAEIKTGSRRIISYLLSPLVRYTHESLRER